MSVIIVSDTFRTIRRVLARLNEQTAKDQLEIVIVIPRGAQPGDDVPNVDGFGAFRIVEVESTHPMPAARAVGIRAASSPIIFLGETHSFPVPVFAEKLIAAHEGEWDAVVPGISNANPESSLSWGAYLGDYGLWNETLPPGQIAGGPTWNVAYKKSVLAEIDDRLETAMEHGDALSLWFHGRNGRAYFEPGAALEHANISQPKWWVHQRYLCGILVGSARKKRWGVGKRLLYVAASPLIPAVIMYRLRKPVMNLLSAGALPLAAVGALFVGAIVRTAGEVVGYVRGADKDAQMKMDEYELRKLSFTSMEM